MGFSEIYVFEFLINIVYKQHIFVQYWEWRWERMIKWKHLNIFAYGPWSQVDCMCWKLSEVSLMCINVLGTLMLVKKNKPPKLFTSHRQLYICTINLSSSQPHLLSTIQYIYIVMYTLICLENIKSISWWNNTKNQENI